MTKKIKILMACDHPLSTSGVGVQSRYMINGLLETGRYSFRVFGGAIKHEDYRTVVVNDDFVIKPTNGFGDKQMLRKALAQERPDVLLLFTDPRFFFWVWEMEDEIHQTCPIAYNHLWDNVPWPEFNRVLYESTDLINCINYPTYEMVHKRFPERTNYIPHAVPSDLFFPMSREECAKTRLILLGPSRSDHFILTFVSRNARRKMPSDVLVTFKGFLNELEKKHSHRKATLIMHTDPMDQEGPNLHAVVEMLHLKDHVVFSKDRVGFNEMNMLYNASDAAINISCAEGFGLSILEAKMAGKPVIALKTGGLTRQVEDHETGEQFGVALEPTAKSLVGNQVIPYINEDFVSHDLVTSAIMKVYEMGPDERERIGKRSREHALKNYDMKRLISDWDRALTELVTNWQTKPQKRWGCKEL